MLNDKPAIFKGMKKSPRDDNRSDQCSMDQIENEVKLLSKLNCTKGGISPHVVKLVGVRKKSHFSLKRKKTTGVTFALEKLDGDLSELLDPSNSICPDIYEELRQNFKFRLDIVLQLAKGIQYIAAHNMVHRDIKLDNTLFQLTQDPEHPIRIALADFGLGLVSDSKDEPALALKRIGNLGACAPEIFYQEALTEENIYYSRDYDVYGFAVTAWEILTLNSLNNESWGGWIDGNKDFSECVLSGARPSLKSLQHRPQLCTLLNLCWRFDIRTYPVYNQRRPAWTEIISTLEQMIDQEQ
eukprot:TRINITY_DN7795_c0_g1_i2.p1 TRINITY_DN7795_c0_g1~~TRINITY_DN7795_c0_g1_i2.p1  ORF type:complete len:298 (+),score=35.82 TRINITY_DN7795_c0_g1_i2:62-955(+)